MNIQPDVINYQMIIVIVDFGKGSKVVKIARKNGIKGATIFLGKGTANNHLLKMLDIDDIRKEIVLLATSKENASNALGAIGEKFDFMKPNHGIGFTVSLENICGHPDSVYEINKESRGNNTSMYIGIFVVVNKGTADDVVESAIKAGARGATIINGRGSGIHEQQILFAFPVEPEKEIIMVITNKDNADQIVQQIRDDIQIDKPGMGILFTININETYGLY